METHILMREILDDHCAKDLAPEIGLLEGSLNKCAQMGDGESVSFVERTRRVLRSLAKRGDDRLIRILARDAGGTYKPDATVARPGQKSLPDEALATEHAAGELVVMISDVATKGAKLAEDGRPPGSRLLRRTWDSTQTRIETFVQRYERGDFHRKLSMWLLGLWPTLEALAAMVAVGV